MEINEKKDLFRTCLSRKESYIVFMAAGETDLSLLPEPATRTEKRLHALCKEKVEAPMKELELAILAARHPADSETPQDSTINNQESGQKPEEEPVKKAAPKRTRKK